MVCDAVEEKSSERGNIWWLDKKQVQGVKGVGLVCSLSLGCT